VRVSNLSFDERDQASLDTWEGAAAEGDGDTESHDIRERHHERSSGGQASLTDFE
ncbi:MAG: hypothetical protein ACI8U4_002365, partial [Natronomonas sp.]